MVAITREESIALRERYGDEVCIAITNRHKKRGRKHYYTEETNRVLFFLERYRSKQNRKAQQKKRGSCV